jgi:ribosomal protein S18 acetylase RimI-like enzyme
MSVLRRLTSEDLPRFRQFWIEHWSGEEIVTRGRRYRPEQRWIGLLTFAMEDSECEVTSLDSLREEQGIGSKLLEQAMEAALARGCKRLFLITTNDNVNMLGFYQKRGLRLLPFIAA